MSDENVSSDEPGVDTNPDYECMARTMVFQSMLYHPLPWRIESDWTQEVTASDGHIIAKCQSPGEAQAIIVFAERIQVELVISEAEFEAMMAADLEDE